MTMGECAYTNDCEQKLIDVRYNVFDNCERVLAAC